MSDFSLGCPNFILLTVCSTKSVGLFLLMGLGFTCTVQEQMLHIQCMTGVVWTRYELKMIRQSINFCEMPVPPISSAAELRIADKQTNKRF